MWCDYKHVIVAIMTSQCYYYQEECSSEWEFSQFPLRVRCGKDAQCGVKHEAGSNRGRRIPDEGRFPSFSEIQPAPNTLWVEGVQNTGRMWRTSTVQNDEHHRVNEHLPGSWNNLFFFLMVGRCKVFSGRDFLNCRLLMKPRLSHLFFGLELPWNTISLQKYF